MAIYRTKDGDMLDAICLAHYGQVTHVEERVLKANPGLAKLGPVYSAGLLIELPALDLNPPKANIVRLWD